MKSIITFISDFGTRDGYAGSVKGVIKSICRKAEIIDIAHDIPPQNISCAAYAILNYAAAFPEDTVHLAVVDPGVGGDRKAIILRWLGRWFVGPDNGLFSLLPPDPDAKIYQILTENILQKDNSSTFHGRDIFAPAAAFLANGRTDKVLGSPMSDMVSIKPFISFDIIGKIKLPILTVDHFGNIISALHRSDLIKSGDVNVESIRFKDRVFSQIDQYYSQKRRGEWLVLWNSLGFLEIAVNGGSAADLIQFDADSDYIYIQTNKKSRSDE